MRDGLRGRSKIGSGSAPACVNVWLITLALAVLAGSCKQKAGPSPQGQAIQVQVPAGSGVAAEAIQATPVQDLTPLRSVAGGTDLVAAGTFEPSGSVFAEPITVTWPLAKAMTAGQTLWVVWLDSAQTRWVGTGDTATVSTTGTHAIGKVRHFSTLGLSGAQPAAMQATESDGKDDPRFTYVNVVRIGKTQAEVVDQAKMEAVKKIYEAWASQAGTDAPMPRSKMAEIYKAGDFKTVKTLIENGVIKQKPRNHSLDMADHRAAMCLEVLTQIAKENGWKVFRSDSGNQIRHEERRGSDRVCVQEGCQRQVGPVRGRRRQTHGRIQQAVPACNGPVGREPRHRHDRGQGQVP